VREFETTKSSNKIQTVYPGYFKYKKVKLSRTE